MDANWHVVQYYFNQAREARRKRKWMQYEFYRSWHLNELEKAGLL